MNDQWFGIDGSKTGGFKWGLLSEDDLSTTAAFLSRLKQ